MSITVTCSFPSEHQARNAIFRLQKRGYMVSQPPRRQSSIPSDPILVAYPFGTAGGNTAGNSLMASLPPMAGNSVMLHVPEQKSPPLVSVLTDDTQVREVRRLMSDLGGTFV